MPQINSQTFPFAPAQAGISQTVQTGSITAPLDGSAQVTVPFAQPFAQICQSVTPAYTPATETDYQVTFQVLSVTVSGFVLVATGAPTGSTGPVSYIAVGY